MADSNVTDITTGKRAAKTDGASLPDSPPKPRRGKQLEIPGAEAPSIPELEEKALELVGMKDQIAALRESVKETKAEMDVILVEHGIDVYKFIEGGVRRRVKASTRRTVDVQNEKGKPDDGDGE